MSSVTLGTLVLLILAAGAQAAGWPPDQGFFPILPWDTQRGWTKPEMWALPSESRWICLPFSPYRRRRRARHSSPSHRPGARTG